MAATSKEIYILYTGGTANDNAEVNAFIVKMEAKGYIVYIGQKPTPRDPSFWF